MGRRGPNILGVGILLLAGLIFAGGTLAVFMAPKDAAPTDGGIAVNRTPDRSRLEIFEQFTPTPVPTPTVEITPAPLVSPTFAFFTPLPSPSLSFDPSATATPSLDPTATVPPTDRPTRPPTATPTRTPRPTPTATDQPTPGAPVARFGATQQGLTLLFENRSLGSGNSYVWDFGDGSGSTKANPQHTYAPGTYTVTLTATNVTGSDSLSKTFTLNNATPPPTTPPPPTGTPGPTHTPPPTVTPTPTPPSKAGFRWNQTGFVKVNFADESTGNPTSWFWDFGDGTNPGNRDTPNPEHVYPQHGEYTVRLTVQWRDGATDSVEKRIEVVLPGS